MATQHQTADSSDVSDIAAETIHALSDVSDDFSDMLLSAAGEVAAAEGAEVVELKHLQQATLKFRNDLKHVVDRCKTDDGQDQAFLGQTLELLKAILIRIEQHN